MNTNYNPDVLNCLANLSSDEVFTPPKLINEMLDLLPQELFSNPDIKFLDPVCKTGVFLREIARRLDKGLEDKIPEKQKRIDHILSKQLFGIAITEITGLLSRRSLYCSKKANGKYSVCSRFESADGNIVFNRIEHDWQRGRCTYCSASQKNYQRGSELETHAYQFIHTPKPEEVFKMKFDVIIGNPPYQLSDGGAGVSATPIYQKFVQQAKKLNPRYLVMIIPSRWFAGGKGLNDFRKEMLNDSHIKKIVDFEDANECFPGVDIAGGICYFLWENSYHGICEIVNKHLDTISISYRSLNEFPTFVRHGKAIPIIRKVINTSEEKMNKQVSSRKPFGLATSARPSKRGDLILYWQKGTGPYERNAIQIGIDLIDKWNVVTSYVGYDHAGNPGKDGKRKIFSKINILPPGAICTETYLVIGSYDNEVQARNLVKYMKTKLFRFLVSQFMLSHHVTKESYSFVPILDMNIEWTDEMLYKRYDLTQAEIDFIESKIRPMENDDE